MADQTAATAFVVAEYEGLKGEQVARIVHRNGLIYSTLAAIAGAVVAVGQLGVGALLLLPPVTLLLGWAYLADDTMVSDLGRYIRLDLSVKAETATGVQDPFGWEKHHRTLPGRTARKLVWLLVAWLVFIGPVFGAAVGFWVAPGGNGLGWWADAILAGECLTSGMLAATFAVRAGLKDGRRG